MKPEPGQCDTTSCHRDAVMTYSFTDGEEECVETDLCLPCRRVIELARRVPWGDESEEWHDTVALNNYLKDHV